MATIKGESRLTFWEATSIIIGHGVGSGILSVPFLAAHNSIREVLLILLFCYLFNLVLHLIIAELSYNNDGAQFISCFDAELFSGRLKKLFTWAAFVLLGVSVIFNVSAFLTGAAAVFRAWFGLPDIVGILIFYVIGAGVVFVGMKLVGICEKIAVTSMVAVVGVLFVATLLRDTSALQTGFQGAKNAIALFSMISFSLSAVMSTPQVVKGLEGDVRRIRGAIAAGLGINAGLILLITLMTLLGARSGSTSLDILDPCHRSCVSRIPPSLRPPTSTSARSQSVPRETPMASSPAYQSARTQDPVFQRTFGESFSYWYSIQPSKNN
jgi:amino acid permease